MTTQKIFELIVNWPAESEVLDAGNLDIVLDFVSEHVGDRTLTRFQDIASILTWLNGDYHSNSVMIGQYHIDASDEQPGNDTAKTQVLRPGTKITIRKPSANDIKFNDMESVQAYLNQGSNHSNEDSEEMVDVLSDDYAPPWNQYHRETIEVLPKPKKTTKLQRVLMERLEKQPTAMSLENIKKKSQIKSADKGLVETMYKCALCDKKYRQRSSLNRHEKSHLQVKVDIVEEKKSPNQTKSKAKKKNNDIPIIPMKTSETIST